jgi:hypothetical protein
MAATKTKPKPSSKARSKPTSKPKSRSTSKAKPKSTSKSTSKSKSKSKSSSKPKSTSKAKSKVISKAKSKAKSATKSKSGSLDKLKVPAAATGAALLAVAGSVAVSQGRGGKSKLKRGLSGKKVIKAVKKVDLPKADDAIDWVEGKAKELGSASYKVAEASSQARSAKKAISGD